MHSLANTLGAALSVVVIAISVVMLVYRWQRRTTHSDAQHRRRRWRFRHMLPTDDNSQDDTDNSPST